MKIQEINDMPLDELQKTPNEKNVRSHPAYQIEELKKSIQNFGQLKDIVVDENNTILIGNGLYTALKELGVKTANIKKYSGLTKNQKKKIMIADNKIFELGQNNSTVLNQYLEDLIQEEDYEIPGFDDELLKDIYADEDLLEERLQDIGNLSEDEKNDIHKTLPDEDHVGNKIELTNDNIRISKNKKGQTIPVINCPHCGKEIQL